jgi:hypothetical protein
MRPQGSQYSPTHDPTSHSVIRNAGHGKGYREAAQALLGDIPSLIAYRSYCSIVPAQRA